MSDIRKQIRRQILGDLIADGKPDAQPVRSAMPIANNTVEIHLCLRVKIEYDAMIAEQSRIVDACKIAGQFPDGLSTGDLSA